MHYRRWRKHGNPATIGRRRTLTVCVIESCGQPIFGREWCSTHYQRWRKTGDPLDTLPRRRRKPCSVDGCDQPNEARGWCQRHYDWWRQRGTVEPRQFPDPQYRGVHRFLRVTRGKASDLLCEHCGAAQAADWAYDHSRRDVARRIDDSGRPYSLNLLQYIPLCRKCHQTFDRSS
jgi:hypothetical protein